MRGQGKRGKEERTGQEQKGKQEIIPLGLEFQHAHGIGLPGTFHSLCLVLGGIQGRFG